MDVMGYAIHLAQTGQKHHHAKPLRGFGGAGVVEIVDDYNTDTYRVMYAVRYAGAVYILHAFQKKSHRGGEMTQQDQQLIRQRLALAEAHWNEHHLKQSKEDSKTSS